MPSFKTLVTLLAFYITLVSAIPGKSPKRPKCKNVKNQNYCNPHCVECKNGVQIRKSNNPINVGMVKVSKLVDEIKKQCYQANGGDYVCPASATSVPTRYDEGTGYSPGTVDITFEGTLKAKDFNHAVALLQKAIHIDSKTLPQCICVDGNCPPPNTCPHEYKISDSYSITMPDVKDSDPFEISFTAHEQSGSACDDLTTIGTAIAGAYEDTAFLGGAFSLLSLACN